MKKISLAICILSVLAGYGSSVDSLQHMIQSTEDEDSLSMIYSRLSAEYRTLQLDEAISFAKIGLEIAQENEFTTGIAENMACIADCYVMYDSMELARMWYQDAGRYYRELKDHYGYAQILLVLGNIYLTQNNYSEALAAYQQSLIISKQYNYDDLLSSLYINTGLVQFKMGNFTKALEYYFKAKELFDPSSMSPALAKTLNNIALVYWERGDNQLAKIYHNQALEIHFRNEGWSDVASTYNDLGEIELKNENYATALDFFSEGLGYIENKTDEYLGPRSYIMSRLFMNMGWTYFKLGNKMEAITNLMKGMDLSKANRYFDNSTKTSMYLSQVYEDQNNYETSLEYYKIFKQYSDSVLNEGNIKKITQLEMQYNFDRKMKEQNLELARKEALQQRRELIGLVIIILVVFAAFIALAMYILQRNRTKREILEKQNLELETRNLNQELAYKKKELTTNVMYLIQNNELISKTAKRLSKVKLEIPEGNQKEIQFIIRDLLDNSKQSIWAEFELRFKEVHSHFYEKLNNLHPDLSLNEKKLCAFLRMNMSTKEISSITYQSVRSIHMARFRLRKKLGIERDDSLNSYLSQL